MTIRPTTGWAALNLKELWDFRDLLGTFASRDVRLRYRQTALGATWVVTQPLMAAGIFSLVFGRIAKLPSDGVPYFLFAFAGVLCWNLFASTLGKVASCLTGNAHLISKVFFPRLILPLSTVLSSLIDFGVALVMLVVLMVINRVYPGWGVLLLPVWMLLTLMLAVGIGLYAAALAVSYRDVQYVLPVLTQFLMYASPVAYAVSAVPPRLRAFYFFNPLAGLTEAFRWSLIGRGSVDPFHIVTSVLLSVVVFVAGVVAFKQMERKFADVI